MAIVNLPIEDIEVITKALRTHDLDSEKVIERAADMEANGMDNTPTAYKLSTGVIVIGDGATRLASAIVLNENGKTIRDIEEGFFRVNLIDKSDDETFTEIDVLEAQIRGNATVEKTDNLSYVNAIYNVMLEKDYSFAELSSVFGVSEKHIRELMKTVRLPKEIRELIGGELSFTNAVKLQKISSKVSNPAYGENGMAEALETAKSMNSGEFADYVNSIDDAHAEKVKAFKAGQPVVPTADPVFTPKAKFIGAGKLLILRDEILSSGTEEEIELINKIYTLDEASIAIARNDWNAKQEDRKAKAKVKKEASKSASDMTDEELQTIIDSRKS